MQAGAHAIMFKNKLFFFLYMFVYALQFFYTYMFLK